MSWSFESKRIKIKISMSVRLRLRGKVLTKREGLFVDKRWKSMEIFWGKQSLGCGIVSQKG